MRVVGTEMTVDEFVSNSQAMIDRQRGRVCRPYESDEEEVQQGSRTEFGGYLASPKISLDTEDHQIGKDGECIYRVYSDRLDSDKSR